MLLVSNVQRFSLHDGPGIRTTVFLKGCPFSCPWCCNPENLSFAKEMYFKAEECVREKGSNCDHCGELLRVAGVNKPEDLAGLSVEIGEWQQVISHSECVLALGVWGEWYDEKQLCHILLEDLPFYRASGGGVTISGGEPLVHPIMPLVDELRASEIDIAVETSLLASNSLLRSLAAKISLFIVDAKILDPEQCRTTIKASLDVFYRNLSLLEQCGAEILLRLPLVLGMTDSADNISAVVELIEDFKLSRVQILPVHNLARQKAAQLGLSHPEYQAPSRARIDSIVAQLSATSAVVDILQV